MLFNSRSLYFNLFAVLLLNLVNMNIPEVPCKGLSKEKEEFPQILCKDFSCSK